MFWKRSQCSSYTSMGRARVPKGASWTFASLSMIPQTVLALRGSDGFSRDPWRVPGVNPRSLGARSCCKNRYLVTLTFAPLERNRWSRAQTHKNSMLFDSLLLRQDRCLSSSHLSCLNSRHLSCLNRRHLSCLNRRRDSCRPPAGCCYVFC